jgi:hypothetical protein
MPIDRFYIGPYDANSGLEKDLKPFMIPDDAFAQLNNAYCWRGRIRKRFGTRWLGQTQQTTRLRIGLGMTNGSGNLSGTVPGTLFNVGQQFSIGSEIYTVVNGSAGPQAMLDTGTTPTATFDVSTGNFVFMGAAINTTVYWYPAQPVTGLATFENAVIDNQPTIAFDTQFAYQYNNGWDRLGTGAAATWTGSTSQYFWATTWTGILASDYFLFVTNFNQNEPNFMRYFDGTNWNNFNPKVSVANNITMVTALILIPFKNRMLAFNVWESTAGGPPVQYANRLRFTTTGSPIDQPAASPPYFPWNSDDGGIGGALDCPTQEAIVTVQYIKDRLIVYLEQSAWEIVYLNNEVYPFAWQQINAELGSESTFSNVPFDKLVLTVGNVGIVGCTGANVDRIDQKIPDEVFQVQNVSNGIKRVYGIRDYFVEMVYWTFPDDAFSSTFPYLNRVLVYNYKNGTWSFNDDSFTVFGYFQPQSGILWSDLDVLWSDNVNWESGSIDGVFRTVCAGNQQGWTFIIDADADYNQPSLQITNITVSGTTLTLNVIDYNMRAGDYVYLSGIVSSGNIATLLNGNIFPIMVNPSDGNNFTIQVMGVTGTYQGGGMVTRVSRIQILTKQYNFYLERGRNFYVSRVDFLIDRTERGEIGVDYFVSTSDLSMVKESNASTGTNTLLGTSILETSPYTVIPFEQSASQLWHPLYFQADGEFIQLNIRLTDTEMLSVDVMEAPFQLHSMIFWTQQTSWYLR